MRCLLRFFAIAPPVPPMMVVTFAALVLIASVVLILDRDRGTAVVIPILVLQMFATASGFGGPARRGYYDLPLTGGAGRLRLGILHWLWSAGPGLGAWLAVAAAERGVGPTRGAVLASGTCVAMFLMSTLPWALSVNMPRFAPSIAWLLLAVTGATLFPEWTVAAVTADASLPASPIATIVYPVLLVGRDVSVAGAMHVVTALGAGTAAVAAACCWICRAGFPLESSQ